jgi:hypothetical protein
MEEYYIGPDMDPVMKSRYYEQMFSFYSWYFRVCDRPAEFSEMIKFAHWQGLKEKMPTKIQLVDFFLEKEIGL